MSWGRLSRGHCNPGEAAGSRTTQTRDAGGEAFEDRQNVRPFKGPLELRMELIADVSGSCYITDVLWTRRTLKPKSA